MLPSQSRRELLSSRWQSCWQLQEHKRLAYSYMTPQDKEHVITFHEVAQCGAVGAACCSGLDLLDLLDLHHEVLPMLLVRKQALQCCVQGDLLLLAAGPTPVVNKALDRVRQFLARDLKLIDHSAHKLLWVTDWPMFEWNEDEQRLEALHHPFTAPNPDDVAAAGGELRNARAQAYDMVYNGVEIGGGSLRIYR